MYSASLLQQTRQTTPSRPCLSDEEVVSLATLLLRDPRAWAAAGLQTGPAREAAGRALRLLEEAMATV